MDTVFDTHAHFTCDREKTAATLERAAAAGVARIMAVGGSPDLNRAALLAAETAEGAAGCAVLLALGFDRDCAGGDTPCDFSVLAGNAGRLAAIGEIGLDFVYPPFDRKAQCELFARQLEIAKRMDLPVSIHTREADDSTLGVLDECDCHRGIIHCFTGSVDFERKLLDRGFMISISGIVTFKAADNVRAAAKFAPDDRLLVETDSPYLAPVPLRGKENEPSFITHTVAKIAGLRGVREEEIARITTTNARRILGC